MRLRNWWALLILFLILTCVTLVVKSAVLPLRDFKGLDTRTSDRLVDPRYSRVAHEVDFSRTLGEIGKRYGYAYVDSLYGDTLDGLDVLIYDSLTALYSAYLSDGKQALIFGAATNNSLNVPNTAIDSTDWANIYMTGFGAASLDSEYTLTFPNGFESERNSIARLYSYWDQSRRTYFTTFNDIVYASNGGHAGVAIDINKSHAATWPLTPPGTPRITTIASPRSDTTYQLNGEYRYAFKAVYVDSGDTNYALIGSVSQPVRVQDGHMLLSGFQFAPDDDSLTPSLTDVQIYRTRANPGRLDESDSAFYVGKFRSLFLTCSTIVYIDSVPDANLVESLFVLAIDGANKGVDSVGAMSRRYGAPSYLASTEGTYSSGTDSTEVGGLFHGFGPSMYNREKLVGTFYNVTFYDTLLNIESDTGRALFVFADTLDTLLDRTIRIGLPKIPSGLTDVVYNLYRGHLVVAGRDTTLLVKTYKGWNASIQARTFVDNGNDAAGYDKYYLVQDADNFTVFRVYMQSQTIDTLVKTPIMLVRQITVDSAAYTDSLRWDSLVLHTPYTRSVPPPFLTSIFGYDNYLFGVQGSRLYQSKQDSSGFGVFDFVSVNEDDGDVGTLARPTRTAIRFYKNKSRYNVYKDNDGIYRQYEIVDGIGCIAPQSGVLTPYGFAFLSNHGVMLENDGEFLERTVRGGLISDKLSNFDNMNAEAKSKAKGVYVDNKYMLYIPAPVDTMYVYDFLAEAWSTWSIDISGAALYGTETVVSHLPGDTLFFYKPNSRSLYKYKVGETDAGTTFTTTWKSVPLLADGYINQVQKIGTWVGSPTEEALTGPMYNEGGAVSPDVTYSSDMTENYQVRELGSQFRGLYTQLSISQAADTNFSIGGFDVYWRRFEDIMSGVGAVTTGDTLTYSSGTGDITEVTTGYGLDGGGTSGSVNIYADTSANGLATKQFVRDSGGSGSAWPWSDSSSYGPDSVAWAANAGASGFALSDFDGTTIDTTSAGKLKVKDAGIGTTQIATGGVQPIDLGIGKFKIDAYYGDSTVADSHYVTKAYADGLAIGGGGGSSDSLFINDGSTQYSIINNLLKLKEGTAIDITREDSTSYDVLRIGVTGIIDSTTAGTGLTETANAINLITKWGLRSGADSVMASVADLDDSLYLRSDTSSVLASITRLNKIADDTAAFIAAKDTVADWDNGALDSTNLALGSVLSSEIKDGDVKPIDLSTGKFKINAFLGDSTVADSQYATIARVNKIADDTTNWNTVYTDYNTNGWETGDIYNGTLEPIDIHNTSKWNGLWYQADTTVADSAAATIARLNKIADDTANFKTAYDSSQHDYYRSNEVVDSATGAARAEVADSALHVDTSYAPLRALVNRHIRDTAAVMIEDSLDNYTLIGHTHDSTGLVDSSVSGRDVKRGTLNLSHIGASGANTGEVPIWSGTAWVPDSNTGTLPANPDLVGSVQLQGFFDQMNRGHWFDTTGLYCLNADTHLAAGLRAPISQIPASADSNKAKWDAVHFNYIYVPWGLFGWKYHAVMTMDDGAAPRKECVYYRVSNDGYTWQRFGAGTADSCPDPLFSITEFTYPDTTCYSHNDTVFSYTSDPDIQMGFDGKLYAIARGTLSKKEDFVCDDSTIGEKDALFVKSTADGTTWGTAVNASGWKNISSSGTFYDSLICPAIWPDTNASWKMVTVLTGGTVDSNSLLLWEAPKADSGWSLLGRVKFAGDTTKVWNRVSDPMGNSTSTIWHFDVVPMGADEQLWLTSSNTGDSGCQFFVGTSRDHGKSLDMCSRPFLKRTNYVTGSWDNLYLYKPAGVVMQDGTGEYIDLFYSANDSGSSNAYWRTGRTRLYFDAHPFTSDIATVHGRSTPPTDSVTLTLPPYNVSSTGEIWLFVDSTNEATSTDMVVVSGKVDGIPDSLIFTYKTNGSIDSVQINGPDFSNGLNRADSLWQSNTTARTSTSEARVAIQLKSAFKRARTGDRFAVRFFITLADDNDFVKVGSVEMKGYKR